MSSQDPCSICRYPSWTEAVCDYEKEERELILKDYDTLLLSSVKGCPGCMVLIKAWDLDASATDERRNDWITFNRSDGHLYVHVFKPTGVLNIDVFTIAEMPRFKHIRPAALAPSSTNLSESLATILQWLQACEQKHQSCRIPNNQVPPRLLDLETGSSNVIRLVEQLDKDPISEVDFKDFRYACLSHCWGKSRFKNLTRRSNLAANLREIAVNDLPRTFRDAIAVSRALRIRYLWIDSLCIIQDDKTDWELHVGEMAQIYQNVHITLAAGASRDDEGGFFQQTTLPYSSPNPFKLCDGELEYQIYLRGTLPHPDENWPEGPVMPLMERGWVFQERLLSRRFLCFAANEILWECFEDVACSCSTTTEGFNYHSHSKEPAFLNCSPEKHRFAKIEMLPRDKLWSLWRNLVTQYTGRDLTFPRDKLPALAGLAKHFQAAKAGQYRHGMWVDCIEKDMLWHNSGYTSDEFRPRKAPSWSWVSATDGVIGWEAREVDSKLQDIRVVDQGPDGCETTESLLSLRGPLVQVSLRREEFSNGMEFYKAYRSCSVYKWTKSDSECGIFSEAIPASSTLSSTSKPPSNNAKRTIGPIASSSGDEVEGLKNSGGIWTDYKFWSDEESLWNLLDDVTFLEVGLEGELLIHGYNGHPTGWTTGLILRACGRKVNGIEIFERIAWLRFDTGKPRGEWKPAGPLTQIFIE